MCQQILVRIPSNELHKNSVDLLSIFYALDGQTDKHRHGELNRYIFFFSVSYASALDSICD